ncbi:ATP-dependent DNA helicase pfh1-like [Silene latifolia]|uniref:ATP-dependent DNA helicase pfh1-like n=1 Tax=Silene latifolia TaxID=37657 RepID=UPI003D782EF1
MEHVNASKPGAFFVDGPGGTGKTFLYNVLYDEVRLVGEFVLPTATSGIAALNIPTGRTTYSRFRIPLDSDVSLACDTDPRFSNFLLSLGNGELQTTESEFIALPEGIVRAPSDSGQDPIGDLSTITFPELSHGTFDPDIFTIRALLTSLNDDMDAINNFLIGKFPGNPVCYKSHDSLIDDNCAIYPTEFINKLNPGGMRPHELILKENFPVILLRNLQPSFELCNGTRLICKRFLQNSIECAIMSGNHKGEHVFIPRIKLQPAPSANYPFQFQRNQFPLKLSFAMTINKCQGQTLSQVAVYLPKPCFAHGQLYVALLEIGKPAK